MNERKEEKRQFPHILILFESFFVGWLLFLLTLTHTHYLPPIALVVMPEKKKIQPPWRGMTHFDYLHVIFLFSLSFLTFFFTSYILRFVLFTHGCVCVCSGTARTQGTGAVA